METRALLDSLAPERARLVAFVRRRVQRASDAEDIVQRALVQAGARAIQLRDPAKLHAWIYRILRRSIADHARAAGATSLAERGDDLDEAPDSRDEEPRGNPCPCTLHLLDELRSTYAEILRLVDLDGEEPSSAAKRLGISVGNAYVRLHRARRALRARLQEHCGVSTSGPCLDCACTADHCCAGPRSTPASLGNELR